MRELTDGLHIYEVAFDRMMQNFGRLGGYLRVIVVREKCMGDDGWFRLGPASLAICQEVQP